MTISNSHAVLTQGPQPGLDRIQQAAKERKAAMDEQPTQERVGQAQVHTKEFDGELSKLLEANQAKTQAFIQEAQSLMQAQGGGTFSQVLGGSQADLTRTADTLDQLKSNLGDRREQMLSSPGSLNGGDLIGMLNQARSALL